MFNLSVEQQYAVLFVIVTIPTGLVLASLVEFFLNDFSHSLGGAK